jgi:hypothetical protein
MNALGWTYAFCIMVLVPTTLKHNRQTTPSVRCEAMLVSGHEAVVWDASHTGDSVSIRQFADSVKAQWGPGTRCTRKDS